MMLQALRSTLRRLLQPPAERVPRAWLHCPICDTEIVGPHPAGTIIPAGTSGPNVIPPAREELIAKCPVHGRRPFNDPNQKPSVRRIPLDQ